MSPSFRAQQSNRLAASGWATCPSVAAAVAAAGLQPITREYLDGTFSSSDWTTAHDAVTALHAHFSTARFASEVTYGLLLVPNPDKLDTRQGMPAAVRRDQLDTPADDVFDERLPAGTCTVGRGTDWTLVATVTGACGPALGSYQQVRRLRRAERREQILTAATNAFARTGFAGTGLDDIAAEAGISRVILYRHFDSKTDLYRAVLDRAVTHLVAATDVEIGEASVRALLAWAARDPAGFRLLFRHAAREPEFCREIDELRVAMVTQVHERLTESIPDGPWTNWAAQLSTTVCLEAIMAWLDAGSPTPNEAADRINRAVECVLQAAR